MATNPITAWADRNRTLIAAVSLIGSFAGLIFSYLDLKSSLEESQKS